MKAALFAALVIAVLACAAPQANAPSSPSPRVPSGGTLRIGIVERPAGFNDPYPYDYHDPKWGSSPLMRCCLVRTLLAYNGSPAGQGGSVPRPDLAAGPPEISADGLTWTFHIKPDIRYAPPYGDQTVKAEDFIRAIERNMRFADEAPDAYADLRAIEGVEQYVAGEAGSISGIEARDPLTLVFRLGRPAGGLAHGVASAVTAPIPEGAEIPFDEDYGPFVAASGPYMFEASQTLPARPVNDGLPAHTLKLIRNPNWDASTDPLRAAHVETIEIRPAGGIDQALAKVERGELDFLDVTLTGDELLRYRSDPAFSGRVHASTNESLYFVQMNLALSPFDDVRVRRALNFALDKVATMEAHTAWRAGDMSARFLREIPVVARHAFPDTHVRGLLLEYDPYPSPDGRGDVARARAEMARSRYDTDADGTCDSAVCANVPVSATSPDVAAPLIAALAAIGITGQYRETGEGFMIEQPETKVPIQLNWSLWFSGMDGASQAFLLHAASFDDPLFEGTLNGSLVGAEPAQLEEWGYPASDVPSLDDKIDACDASASYLRFVCYAELDQLVSEQVVPWVPVYSHLRAWVVSTNITRFSLDQGAGVVPAIDQISLRR